MIQTVKCKKKLKIFNFKTPKNQNFEKSHSAFLALFFLIFLFCKMIQTVKRNFFFNNFELEKTPNKNSSKKVTQIKGKGTRNAINSKHPQQKWKNGPSKEGGGVPIRQ